MDHEYIREHQIVSLYLASKLPQAECADFEDHLAACRQCMDELELTDDFRRTLRDVAAADAIRTPVAEKAWPWFAATAALLAAAVFIGALYLGQKRELEGTRAASAAWEQRYRREQTARQTAESQGAAPLFALNLTRAADAGAEPANVVAISGGAKSIVLGLEGQNESEWKSVRLKLTDAAGRAAWSTDGISAPVAGALAITLPTALFQPGRYLLTVEGERGGRYTAIGHYSFRVEFTR